MRHPAWCFLFEAPGISLHTAGAPFAELPPMNLSGPGGFIELGKIYRFQPSVDFSPGFEGANEPGLLFQAVLKWSPRRLSLAEEAQQILVKEQLG